MEIVVDIAKNEGVNIGIIAKNALIKNQIYKFIKKISTGIDTEKHT